MALTRASTASTADASTYARLWYGLMTARVILALAIVALQALASAMGQGGNGPVPAGG